MNPGRPPTATLSPSATQQPVNGVRFWALALGSVGVVFGDIGTSPLYAFRLALLAAADSGSISPSSVLGVLSLILWSLIIIVSIKYVLILLRADNDGEGGTLSLTALVFRALGGQTPLVLMLGIVGAAMFYGSSLITPALSVLAAVEGLKIATPAFEPFVLPVTVVILLALFAVQSRGTGRVALLFGPLMTTWFVAIAIFGALHIVDSPGVLAAVNPVHAVTFLVTHPAVGLATLGFVFLAVTGGEALYADLGHFGRGPIQTAWFGLVLPALVINYFGQGALVLSDPGAIEHPFYRLVPEGLRLPMVALATAATAIASQAVITGAYSLTQQAIQLGLLPRLVIRHTSEAQHGQIYMPRINAMLCAGALLLVGLFQTSSALAAAYGLAVATTMAVDGLLAVIVIRQLWHWSAWRIALVAAPFVLVDVLFLCATLTNFFEGAWLPVLFGAVVVLLNMIWRQGTAILVQKTQRTEVPLEMLVNTLERKPPFIVPGTAIYLTSNANFAPAALLHNLKHNKVLHEQNVVVTVVTADVPRVSDTERVSITRMSPRFIRATLCFGFMERPNVPKALTLARKLGWTFDIMSTSFFVSRRSLKPAVKSDMPHGLNRIFINLARSASNAADFFQIPTGRVVEIGMQVTV
jgi:KUP system potassium uptake protein